MRAAVHAFLLRVEVLPWANDAAESYGTLRATLEGKGTPLGSLDTLIAAHALAAQCILVSNDKAFQNLSELTVQDWSAA